MVIIDWIGNGIECFSSGLRQDGKGFLTGELVWGEAEGVLLVARDGRALKDQVDATWFALRGVVWRWHVL